MLRQYHPSALEKPLIQRFFAYKVFFRRTYHRKNEKCGVTAANTNFGIYRQIDESNGTGKIGGYNELRKAFRQNFRTNYK